MSKHSDLELKMMKTKKLEDLKNMNYESPISTPQPSESDESDGNTSYGDEENSGLNIDIIK